MKKMNKRRSLLWIAAALMLIVPFQNCGRNFQTVDGVTTLSSTQGGGDTTGGGTTPTTTNPTTSTTMAPTKPCLATDVGAPEMGQSSTTTVQVLSGRGDSAGRKASNPITVTYNKSNAASHCSQAVTVQCNMMNGSTVTAMNTAGVRANVDGQDITCTRTPGNATPGTSISISFRSNDNDTDKQCFQGTAQFQVNLRSSADTNKTSASQTITVNFKNNCYPEQITTDSLDSFDQMGTAVAIDGSTAAIIAPGDDGDSNQTQTIGAIYIYRKSGGTWNRSQILRTDDTSIVSDRGAAGDTPAALALKSGVLVVGSEFNSGNAGAVYIFKDNGGTFSLARKLSGAISGGRFGRAVATDGSQIAVGAPGENSAKGAVYIFDAVSFAQTGQIASPLASNAYMGAAVAIEGSTLAVGAPASTLYRDTMTGELLVYRKSGGAWSEASGNPLRGASKTNIAAKDNTGKATTITVAMGSELGSSVAISGGVIVIGSPGFLSGTKKTGMALVLGTDMSLQTLPDFSGSEGRFGTSVAISSGNIIVGVPEVRTRGGAVDHFALSGGVYQFSRRVSSGKSADNDQFGFAVGISGTHIVVGAKLNAEPNNASGSASFISTVIP